MSCCGSKRRRLRQVTPSHKAPKTAEKPRKLGLISDSPVYFQYIGKTSLRLVGPRTRKLYLFNYPGAEIAVDPRDQFALENVSTLKKVIKAS